MSARQRPGPSGGRRPRARRPLPAGGLTAALLGTALVLPVAGAAADDEYEVPDPPAVTQQQIDASVRTFGIDGSIRTFSAEGSIESLGDEQTEEEDQTVIALSTDLLFTPNSWELPDGAGAAIADLVADVPEGATVRITGHTDSRTTGEDFDNLTLSENRADAVAQALAAERPDLALDVSGVGDTDPAVEEDPEDESTFAANRRVEIAHDS